MYVNLANFRYPSLRYEPFETYEHKQYKHSFLILLFIPNYTVLYLFLLKILFWQLFQISLYINIIYSL
jgi:hypothetical protein